ncbi:MAG: DMT family transporter [Candidatus Aegiribacteria sp.]|nr:DMT family transporter [Candidatus Aegiribacteria sp.]
MHFYHYTRTRVGIAYTLQIVAHKRTHPSHAAIVMSLKTVFVLIGGRLMLGETVTPQGIFSCLLMFTAIILSGIENSRDREIPI